MNKLQQRGELLEATQHWLVLEGIDPESARGQVALGHARRALGEHEAALGYFRRALELESDRESARQGLEQLRALTGDGS